MKIHHHSKTHLNLRFLSTILILTHFAYLTSCKKSLTSAQINPGEIESLLQLKNTSSNSHVYQAHIPSFFFETMINGQTTPFPEVLKSNLSIQGTNKKALLLVELKLTEKLIQPTLKLAIQHQLQVESLTQAFLNDQPQIFLLHLSSQGSIQEITKRFLKFVEEPVQFMLGFSQVLNPGLGKTSPLNESSLTLSQFKNLFWNDGVEQNGVFSITKSHGANLAHFSLGADSGFKSWISMRGTPEQAQFFGEVSSVPSELNETLFHLLSNSIQINSIYRRTNEEKPALVFIRFQGVGKAAEISQAFKKAITVSEEHQSN